jgi:hypothetical protein
MWRIVVRPAYSRLNTRMQDKIAIKMFIRRHRRRHDHNYYHWLYSPRWALASWSKCRQRLLSRTAVNQFLQPSFLASSSTLSVHLDSGRPRPRWPPGFVHDICLGNLEVISSQIARFQVLTAVLLKIQTFWDVSLYHWVSDLRRFEGSWRSFEMSDTICPWHNVSCQKTGILFNKFFVSVAELEIFPKGGFK